MARRAPRHRSPRGRRRRRGGGGAEGRTRRRAADLGKRQTAPDAVAPRAHRPLPPDDVSAGARLRSPVVQRRHPPGDDAPCRPHRYRPRHRPRHLRTSRSGSPRSDVTGGRTGGWRVMVAMDDGGFSAFRPLTVGYRQAGWHFRRPLIVVSNRPLAAGLTAHVLCTPITPPARARSDCYSRRRLGRTGFAHQQAYCTNVSGWRPNVIGPPADTLLRRDEFAVDTRSALLIVAGRRPQCRR